MEIVVLIAIFVLGGAACVIGVFRKGCRSLLQQYLTAVDKRALLRATGNPELTRLVMLLREDLPYHSRAQEKLRQIGAHPELAMTAFQTALDSNDAKMQKVGIMAIAHLNRPEGVKPLLRLHSNDADVASRAADALIGLARVCPVSGQGGFLKICSHIGQAPCGSSSALRAKLRYLEKLLTIAMQRRADFSDEDYHALFNWAIEGSDQLALSKGIPIRHAGEDSRRAIERIQSEAQRLERQQAGAQRRQRESEQQQRKWQQQQREQRQQQRSEQAAQQRQVRVKNYYKILQVDPSAEPEVIAGAYRRLAAKYHPDVYKGQDATQKMQLINEAYAVLSDPARRKQYDALRASQASY